MRVFRAGNDENSLRLALVRGRPSWWSVTGFICGYYASGRLNRFQSGLQCLFVCPRPCNLCLHCMNLSLPLFSVATFSQCYIQSLNHTKVPAFHSSYCLGRFHKRLFRKVRFGKVVMVLNRLIWLSRMVAILNTINHGPE